MFSILRRWVHDPLRMGMTQAIRASQKDEWLPVVVLTISRNPHRSVLSLMTLGAGPYELGNSFQKPGRAFLPFGAESIGYDPVRNLAGIVGPAGSNHQNLRESASNNGP
jgi:hypothetical protein